MTRWERLEQYLFEHDKDGTNFSVEEYVATLGLDSTMEGTYDIQAHLKAQRASRSKTLFLLRRVPGTRTSNSRWAAGVRTKDARQIGKGLANDTKRRVERAFMPDLIRLRTLNPRAARQVEAQISAVVDGAMLILASAAEGIQADED